MRKFSYLLITVFIFSISQLNAQGFHLGIKAGGNSAKLQGRSFTDGYQFAFSVGAFAELNITSKWGIQPELLFSQTKTQTVSNFDEIYPAAQGINNQSTSLNYLSIPILLSWKPIPLLSFQLGPQFGMLLSTSENILGTGQDAFKSGARYVSGLTNLDNIGNQDTWKNQSFQVYIGLRIL